MKPKSSLRRFFPLSVIVLAGAALAPVAHAQNLAHNAGSTLTLTGDVSYDNVLVGSGGGSTSTIVDATGTDSFTSNGTQFYVGAHSNNTSIGTLNLGILNNITANQLTIGGLQPDANNATGHAGRVTTLANGTTTINATEMAVGTGKGNGSISGQTGGRFILGADATLNLYGLTGSESRANLVVGRWASGNAHSGNGGVDLSAGIANLHLSELAVGRVTAGSGGSGNAVTGVMTLGTNASNHLDVSGAGSVVKVGFNNQSGGLAITSNGTLTIGNLNSTSSITSTDNSDAVLVGFRGGAGQTANGTLNFNGGTLAITTTGAAIAGAAGTAGAGTSTLNLSGEAKLVAGASSTDWIRGLTTATIGSGGATIDTNGFDLGVSQAFSGAGGLSKEGAGTLTLSGANSFTGASVVSGGKLVIASAGTLLSSDISIGAAELQFNSTVELPAAPVFTSTGGRLSGTGTINGALDVTTGNALAVVNPAGTLSLTGLTLGDDTTVEVASGGSGMVHVEGDYTDSLGAHTLRVGLDTPDTAYPFIEWTGTSNVSDGLQVNWTVEEGDTGTKNWTAATSGDWETAASWDGMAGTVLADTTAKTLSYTLTYVESGTKAPASGNDVVIDPVASSITVTGPSTASTVNSLQVGGNNLSSPTLTLGTGSLTVNGGVTVAGNGTMDATASALIASTLNVTGSGASVALGNADGNIATANVSAGILTVSAGSVATANLSGTGSLAGSQAVGQVNITGGTPSFSGNATVMTVTGGDVSTTGGTIGTFHHDAGAGTSTIGMDTLVTAANVSAGIVNFNSTQANGTLTLPVGSTGTVVFGSGANLDILDLSAGEGSVTAESPLSITGELILPDSLSVSTDGPAFTVETAALENLANNDAIRTFTANGGKMTLSTTGAPDATGISYTQVTNDADSGISSAKTYTHALDFGSSGAATVNGVAFATAMNQSVGGRSNSGTRTYGSSTHAGNTPPAVTGSVASVFTDMVFGGPSGYVELTGLTPGGWYDVKLYERAWDYNGSIRTYTNSFDVGADGIVEYTTPKIDQNRAHLTPPGMSGNVSWVTSYVYMADSSGKMRVTIDLASDRNGDYHFYGMTNEVVPAGAGDVNFPNTHVVAAGTSEISLGAPATDQLLGNLSVTGNDATVTLSDAQSISFNQITASESASITGVPLSLRGGEVTVTDGKVLTIDAPFVDGASPTALNKLEGGILTLGGLNTYSGNTTVAAGSLVLADNAGLTFVVTDSGSNKITGAGSATLAGGFTIDTSAVTLESGSWVLVDAATKSFTSTFSVDGGWSQSGGVWTLVDDIGTWQFSQSTGTLTLNDGAPPVGDYDDWAAQYPTADLSDPNADFDGDGLSNFEEYAFGLNPTSGASVNPITDISELTDGIFSYTRRASSGLTYTYWISTDLQDWGTEPAAVLLEEAGNADGNGVQTVDVAIVLPEDIDKIFIRVKAE